MAGVIRNKRNYFHLTAGPQYEASQAIVKCGRTIMSKLGSNLVQFQAAHRTLILLAEDPQSGSTRQAGKMATLADNPGGWVVTTQVTSLQFRVSWHPFLFKTTDRKEESAELLAMAVECQRLYKSTMPDSAIHCDVSIFSIEHWVNIIEHRKHNCL